MAKNPAPNLPNRHVFVAAKSGGGKSQAMRNRIVPKTGIRALFWDVDHDHNCKRYTDKGAFMRAVKSADKSGKPFRIGWSGDDSQETFEWFCNVAWAILDGKRITWVVSEELADLDMGQKTPPFLKKLLVRGRKYGCVFAGTTQRCQEVPKLLITQPAIRYIGLHEDHDARYLERATGIKSEAIEALEELEFWVKESKTVEKTRIKYQEFTPK